MRNILMTTLATAALGLGATSAHALTYTGSGTDSNGHTLSATADFSISGGNLIIVLTNTTADIVEPQDVLTGVYFTWTPATTFGSGSVVLTAGSTVVGDPFPAGGVVGGEFAYLQTAGFGHGTNQGVSSAGLGVFGAPTFPGPNLENPVAVNGLQYGLTSCTDNPATTNGGLSTPLIKCSVTITLTGVGAGSLANLSNVWFQFGTALSEPSFPGCPPGTRECRPPLLPEPGSLALLGLGLIGLGVTRRKTNG